jgi:hypothetical protein
MAHHEDMAGIILDRGAHAERHRPAEAEPGLEETGTDL